MVIKPHFECSKIELILGLLCKHRVIRSFFTLFLSVTFSIFYQSNSTYNTVKFRHNYHSKQLILLTTLNLSCSQNITIMTILATTQNINLGLSYSQIDTIFILLAITQGVKLN